MPQAGNGMAGRLRILSPRTLRSLALSRLDAPFRQAVRHRRRLGTQAADSRLAQTAGADPAGVFTSDLSVSEYVLLGEAGFEPLGFVVGSSIYHVGLQVGRWSQNKASEARSSGIVGVNVAVANHVWGAHATEFLATGTAIRRLADEHKMPDTTPRPTFTLGLDR